MPTANGTRVEVEQDLELSGAAAQYGRGMVNDVSAIMLRDFAANMQARIEAYDKGLSPDQMPGSEGRRGLRDRLPGSLDGAEASGPPVLHALSTQSEYEEETMTWWWIGNAILLLAVVPILVFLLNRVLAACGADQEAPRTTSSAGAWP